MNRARMSLVDAEGFLDETWYLATYPQVRADLDAGRADSARDHYENIGHRRGYLASAGARRPRNPASHRSEFGGLWTDQGNALDLVEGKLALGFIDEADARLLRSFITDGYVVLRNAVPSGVLSNATLALEDAYNGKIPDLKFACPSLGFEVGPWDARVRDLPAKALEIHAASGAIRDAIFSSKLVRFLNLVFERPALASQSLGFYRGSGQNLHQDTAYVTYSLPMQFVASWVALEDVEAGAGELMYRVGSQALGEFLYDGEFKSMSEAQRAGGSSSQELLAQEVAHSQSLAPRADQAGHADATFLAKRGDILIWAADLAHGGRPISLHQTRKSVVTHYCPIDVAPLYFENIERPAIFPHESGASYTTFLDQPRDVPGERRKRQWRGLTAWLRRPPKPRGAAPGRAGDFAAALLAVGFDTRFYGAENPDLTFSDLYEAALHYHRFGRAERRRAAFKLAASQSREAIQRLGLSGEDSDLLRQDIVASVLRRLHPSGDDPDCLSELMSARGRDRAILVIGDSHGHFYLGEEILRRAEILPLPFLCTGASARGLGNPNSRAGYGAKILDFLRAHQDTLEQTPILLKFGQVDLEFVHDFQRIREGRRAFNQSDAEAFATDSAHRYVAYAQAVQAATPARVVVTCAFPPALRDEALRAGYVNAHIAQLHEETDRAALEAGLAQLEMPDLAIRTRLARTYNKVLAEEATAAGLRFFDDFSPLLGDDELIRTEFVEAHGGTDHHMAFSTPACGAAAASLASRIHALAVRP